MSVFDVLGATATIIQFIECGIKFGNKVVAVYGGRGRFAELEQMTQDFQQRNQSFKKNLQLSSSGPDSGEEVLLQIAEECQQTGEELTQLINRLSMKQEERSKWNAFKSTAKTEYRKDEVTAKQEKLELLRRRCHEQLSIMISDRQFALAVTLARIEHNQAASESTLARQLTELKDQVISSIAEGKRPKSGDLVQKLSAAQRVATHDLPQESILASLRYVEIENRQSRIVDPSEKTYGWMFEEARTGQSSTQYMQWLRKDGGIFWVTGKAGSGKSTLMKYIYKDVRTHSALQTWANGRQLFTASHYFWYLGSQVEKSFSGLMRSVLYKILSSCPDLIESVCEDRWQNELDGRDTSVLSWSIEELQECLSALVSQSLEVEGKKTCFCFFIDGLDEYDGDREVINALARLAQSGHTKICASSRPWNRFTDAFSASRRQGNYLELHQHTRGDIATYVEEELGSTLSSLSKVYEDWEPLVREVIDRSEGVFLWVTLVVKRELRPMLEDRESISTVRKRLDEVPSDLHEYFQRIFERIWADDERADERYGADTAKIFKSSIAANGSLPAAAFPVIVCDSPYDMAMSTHVEKDFLWGDPVEIDIIRAQVNRRCQDLLSVVLPPGFPQFESRKLKHRDLCRIEFLHRSVQDFLQQCEPVSEKLDRLAGPSFNADRTLLACYIFFVKKAGHQLYSTPDWSTRALMHLASIGGEYDISAAKLLQELDKSMQLVFGRDQEHWSNRASEILGKDGESVNHIDLAERGNRNLVGHLIELNLIHPVREALADRLPAKRGRPLLDYALRFNPVATFRVQSSDSIWHSSTNPEMVEFLLSMGCNVNEPIQIYKGRTVWDLYLAFLSRQKIQGRRHCRITWLLINHGAKPIKACIVGEQQQQMTDKYRDVTFGKTELSMKEILASAFGQQEAENMCERISKNEVSGNWLTRLTTWKPQRNI